jgi:hypothetical protein
LIGNGNEIAFDEFDVTFIGPAPTTNDCESATVRITRGAQPEPLVFTSDDLFKRKEVDEAIVVSVQDASGKELPECLPTFELRVWNPSMLPPTGDFSSWDRLTDSLTVAFNAEFNSRAYLEGAKFNFQMSAEELDLAGSFLTQGTRVVLRFQILVRVPGSNTIGTLVADSNILPKHEFDLVLVPSS